MSITIINLMMIMIIIFLLLCMICRPIIENYLAYEYLPPGNCLENAMGQINCFTNPFAQFLWDGPLRHTRNSSYDIRGDPIVIPPKQYAFLNPE